MRQTGTVSIQVNVSELIDVLEKKQKESQEFHKRAVLQWRESVKESAEEMKRIAGDYAKASLKNIVSQVEEIYSDEDRRYGYRKSWGDVLGFEENGFPSIPKFPEEPKCLQSRIDWLKMCGTDTIKLSYDQYESALRGCW